MSTLPDRENPDQPKRASEARLLEIRRQAETRGAVSGKGIRPVGAPFPVASVETGYYGIPLLKEPQWTPEIPLYFFFGGAAGSAAVIGAAADWLGKDEALAQTARWLAFGGSLVSAALLISDLGRPSRFLNMLRVVKVQSPMSLGAWTLSAFGMASGAVAFAKAAERRFGGGVPVRVIGNVSQFASALLGLPVHNYTGVLIGATVIPVWNKNVQTLPILFGMSGVQAGVSMLELLGHADNSGLNLLGIGSALGHTWGGFHLESRKDPALRPLKRGSSGWIIRVGGVLSGPVVLALRLFSGRSRGMRRAAAICGIAGSLLARYGWMQAGHASARDWRLPLETPTEQPAAQENISELKTPKVKLA